MQSRRLLLIIFIAIAVIVVIGTLVPQKADLNKAKYEAWQSRNPTFAVVSEALGLTHIFTSWWFIAVLLALFLSLIACEYTQIKTAYKSLRVPFATSQDPLAKLSFEKKIAGVGRKEAGAMVGSELRRRRFRIIGTHYEDESQIRARRFYFSWAASPFFHLGLVLILVGAIISVTTRSEGHLELGEGQVFTEAHQSYLRVDEGPFFREQHKGFQVRLDKFTDMYWANGSLKQVQSKITLIDKGGVIKEDVIEVNKPLTYKGVIVYQSSNQFGYATQLSLELEGQPPSSGLVFFPRSEEVTETTIYPPGANYQIEASLFYKKNPPLLQIHVRRGRESIYTGTLRLGEEVKFENDVLQFDKMIRWSGFSVIQDRGIGLIFNSFWLSFAALLIIIFLSPKELVFTISECEDGTLVKGGGRGKRHRLPWGSDVDTTVKEILASLDT